MPLRKLEAMRVAIFLITLVIAVQAGPTSADPSVAAHAVLARNGEDALLLWDATSEVSAIVSSKLSDDDANARLNRIAIRVLADSSKIVSPMAKSVMIRVLYTKSGAVSPVYGGATFAGVEHYGEITISGGDYFRDRDRWKELKENASIPAWLRLRVTGELPPRS